MPPLEAPRYPKLRAEEDAYGAATTRRPAICGLSRLGGDTQETLRANTQVSSCAGSSIRHVRACLGRTLHTELSDRDWFGRLRWSPITRITAIIDLTIVVAVIVVIVVVTLGAFEKSGARIDPSRVPQPLHRASSYRACFTLFGFSPIDLRFPRHSSDCPENFRKSARIFFLGSDRRTSELSPRAVQRPVFLLQFESSADLFDVSSTAVKGRSVVRRQHQRCICRASKARRAGDRIEGVLSAHLARMMQRENSDLVRSAKAFKGPTAR